MKKLLLPLLLILASCTPKGTFTPSEAQAPADSSKIIGGEAAKENDLVTKSTVSMVMEINGKPFSICTGTLISKNLVLSAYHCVAATRKQPFKIFFGTVLPTSIDDKNLIDAEDFIGAEYDEKYDTDGKFITALGDVSVIKLKEEAPAGFEPVPILSEKHKLEPGLSMLLAGYGAISDSPKKAAIGLNLVRVPLFMIYMDAIVVTDQTMTKGACAGDSGGPAYLETPKGLLVYGITRGPHNKAPDCHHYGEYTYASKYEKFILDASKELGGELPVFAMP